MPVKEKPIFLDFFNLDERALGIIADRYGLSDIDCFLPILLDGNECTLLEVRSATSKKVIVETGSGLYFFKQIPWYCDTVEQITASTTIQNQLKKAGSPLPGIIPTRDAKLWTEIGDAKFVLFEFATGRRYTGTQRQKLNSARALASMHLHKIAASTAPREDLFELVRDHIILLEEVTGKRGEKSAALTGDFIGIVSSAEQAARSHGWSSLPVTAIHGDYNPWNLIFDPSGEVTGILDFDNCDVASRVHDIAEALLTHCILKYRADSTNFASTQDAQTSREEAWEFLASYEAIAPLSSAESGCLPFAIQAIYVELISLASIRQDISLAEASRILPAIIELPEWWERISNR